jgi:hypothetical protein
MLDQQYSCLESFFWLPAWWVRAYDFSQNPESDFRFSDQGMSSCLFPLYSSFDLKTISIVLSEIHKQLFELSDMIRLSSESHRRLISIRGRGRLQEYEKKLHDVVALRLVYNNDSGPNKTHRTIPLFAPNIQIEEKMDSAFDVLLELSPFGGELLLGLFEPYSELARSVGKEPQLEFLLGDRPPLSLWRSAWLDLAGVEQTIFLNLEKGIQWEGRSLSFDGSYGIGYEEIDCKLGERFKSFKEKVVVLDRLGRKLCEHGILTSSDDHQYYAFSHPGRSAVDFIWEIPVARLLGSEVASFYKNAHRFLFEKVYLKYFDQILSIVGDPNSTYQMQKNARAIINELRSKCGERVIESVAQMSSNCPLLAGPLFMEWTLRNSKRHPFALPAAVKSSFGDLLGKADSEVGDIAVRFEKFVQRCVANPKLIEDILADEKAACLASREMREEIEKRSSSAMKIPESNKMTEVVVAEKSPPPAPAPDVPTDDARRMNVLVRKKACEELNTLREKYPDRYIGLKKAYMDNLDAQSRLIVQEVQKRLQPDLFDQQLKNSLVKFMVDNPSLWMGRSNSN